MHCKICTAFLRLKEGYETHLLFPQILSYVFFFWKSQEKWLLFSKRYFEWPNGKMHRFLCNGMTVIVFNSGLQSLIVQFCEVSRLDYFFQIEWLPKSKHSKLEVKKWNKRMQGIKRILFLFFNSLFHDSIFRLMLMGL